MISKIQTLSRFNLLLILFTSFISCSNGDEVKLVKTDYDYSIEIPAFLTKVSNLNEDASLQYQHAWKELYMIVIDENKTEMDKAIEEYDLSPEYSNNLKGYTNLILFNFEENLGLYNISVEDTYINQLPAKQFSTTGLVDGIEIFYSVALIEGKHKYYQVMTWTLADKKNQYEQQMKDAIQSFKEI